MKNGKTSATGSEDKKTTVVEVSTDFAAEIASLKAELAEKNEYIVELNKTIEEQDEVIEGLNKELSAPKTNGKPTIEHAGITYEIGVKSFSRDKKIVTAAELQNDPKMIKALVEEGCGFLKPISEQE